MKISYLITRQKKIVSQKKERKNPYLMVVAIDFGTSYSGYAYSTRDDFLTFADRVHTCKPCSHSGQSLMSMKTPTCLLVNENKEFVAFGYDAETEYAKLCASNDQSKYFYFQRFKMKLYQVSVFSLISTNPYIHPSVRPLVVNMHLINETVVS